MYSMIEGTAAVLAAFTALTGAAMRPSPSNTKSTTEMQVATTIGSRGSVRPIYCSLAFRTFHVSFLNRATPPTVFRRRVRGAPLRPRRRPAAHVTAAPQSADPEPRDRTRPDPVPPH